MKKLHIIYNPHAGNGRGESAALTIRDRVQEKIGSTIELTDMTKIFSYKEFMEARKDVSIVICGGDGTLNRFINATSDLEFDNKIYYCAIGTGNDFLRDIGIKDKKMPVDITKYIKNLPICEVDGKRYRFLNGVGYGIDGYCCEVSDDKKKKSSKKVNYTLIALKGVMYDYKPRNAVITVDGVIHHFKQVWIAPTMNGRFYGGGIMAAPFQDRTDEEKTLSVTVLHTKTRLGALYYFPSLYKGGHAKHKNVSTTLKGKEITVEFDEPCALQIDGETFLNIKKYTVYAYGTVGNPAKEAIGVK
jgi:YegS/Rv2252/BmrU family lipid kinase